MARQRKGLPVNGWLIFDKPQGMTSTQAVTRVKRLYQAAKAGHAGTLDPLATGVLPIALGEATKTVPFVVEGTKQYRFTVRFGAETDTDDAEGKVVASSETRPTRAEIEAELAELHRRDRAGAAALFGAQGRRRARLRACPRRGGFRACRRAACRSTASRLADHPDPDHCVLEAHCGKGTYVRALARDLGRALGALGHVEATAPHAGRRRSARSAR